MSSDNTNAAPAVAVTPAAPAAPAPAAPAPAPAAAAPAAPKPAAGGNKTWKTLSPFVLGGLSGMAATTVIQPLDMIKVQIQLAGEGQKGKGVSPFAVASNLMKTKGPLFFYKGLGAGLLRQATYTTARLGLFRTISNAMATDGKPLPFWKKTVAGLAAGGLGAIFGTPADVALIRMQADHTLPVEQRRNYTGVGNALARITREEGLKGLFAGNTPVVVRAMALNVGMLATHDQALETFKALTGDATISNVGAKLVSGFFASAFSLPFDFVKTRLQKQKPGPDGSLPYKGALDCAVKVTAQEGPLAFYRGFGTYYVRIAPHAMITLVVLDALNAFTKTW